MISESTGAEWLLLHLAIVVLPIINVIFSRYWDPPAKACWIAAILASNLVTYAVFLLFTANKANRLELEGANAPPPASGGRSFASPDPVSLRPDPDGDRAQIASPHLSCGESRTGEFEGGYTACNSDFEKAHEKRIALLRGLVVDGTDHCGRHSPGPGFEGPSGR